MWISYAVNNVPNCNVHSRETLSFVQMNRKTGLHVTRTDIPLPSSKRNDGEFSNELMPFTPWYDSLLRIAAICAACLVPKVVLQTMRERYRSFVYFHCTPSTT